MRRIVPILCMASLVGTTVLAGCSNLGKYIKITTNSGRSRRAQKPGHETLSSYECKQYGMKYYYEPFSDRLNQPLKRQIIGMVCHAHYWHNSVARNRPYVHLYYTFDDAHFNDLTASRIVMLCVGDRTCNARNEPITVGEVYYFAKNVRPANVRSALQKLGVSKDVRQTYMKRFRDCRNYELQQAKSLDARRKAMYVDLPLEIYAWRAAHRQKYATYYQRFAQLQQRINSALRSQSVNAGLLHDALKLRRDYMHACIHSDSPRACLLGPIARPLTQRIVSMSIALKRSVLAHAEQQVLDLGPDMSNAPMEIRIAQYQAMKKERKQYDAYARAKRGGVDAATLASQFGNPPPIAVSAYRVWSAPAHRVHYGVLLRSLPPVGWVGATVRGVRRHGKMSKIFFKTEVSSWNSYDCHDTNRVDRIEPDGKVVYRQKCKFRKTHIDRKTTPPIWVPTAEARHLRRGESVYAVFSKGRRHGLIVKAWKSAKRRDLVQIRSYRVKK